MTPGGSRQPTHTRLMFFYLLFQVCSSPSCQCECCSSTCLNSQSNTAKSVWLLKTCFKNIINDHNYITLLGGASIIKKKKKKLPLDFFASLAFDVGTPSYTGLTCVHIHIYDATACMCVKLWKIYNAYIIRLEDRRNI